MLHKRFHVFWLKKLSSSSISYNLERGIHPSITDIAVAMSTLIQEKPNHNETV